MPLEVSKKLLLKREIDHEIELEYSAKPPALLPYCMVPPKLQELRKQLIHLLDMGYIRPC